MSWNYDLIVIGSGPAGEKGSVQAAYFGKKVAVVERAPDFGGAGINTGTVPSKTLRETALYFSGLRQRGLYGIDYSLKENITVAELMYRQKSVVDRGNDLVAENLKRHHVETFQGEAKLRDAHTVVVHKPDGTEQELTAEFLLIATGSSPLNPPDVPFDGARVYDSDTILQMKEIPKNMAVVGGGVIGCEYACTFTALGVEVILIEGSDRVLRFVDSEIAERLRMKLELLGLRFIFKDRVRSMVVEEKSVRLELMSGSVLDPQIVLFAAGRKSNTDNLGLETVGVKLGDRGLVLVNDKYQTSVPNIYAAGDVIGFPALASVSMEQARVAMVHAFDLKYKENVSPVLPHAIYTIPEISMVGVTEDECKQKNIPYMVGRSFYENNARGQIIGDTSGMLKLICSPDKKLLGVHLIGEFSSELIHIGAMVIAAGGSIDAFIYCVYNYPTLSELYKYAAYDALGNLQKSKQ